LALIALIIPKLAMKNVAIPITGTKIFSIYLTFLEYNAANQPRGFLRRLH
jgi:hypothetical protein